MGHRNQEGYSDPTAGQAYANIRREERAKSKAARMEKLREQAGYAPKKRKHPPRRRRRDYAKEGCK